MALDHHSDHNRGRQHFFHLMSLFGRSKISREAAAKAGTDLFLPVSNQFFIHETILYPAVLSGNDKLSL